MDFTVKINASLVSLGIGDTLAVRENKWLLCLLNDWEDGVWRYTKFNDFVWDNIADTALSTQERNALCGSPRQLLRTAAKKLRLIESTDDIGAGGELAEAILYGVMRNHYKALPVVPKIFYKQNTGDYAKGSDSVHIVLKPERGFQLWFGEAKFYNSIENVRLDAVTQSILNALNTEKLKKENSIIVSLNELDQQLDDEELVLQIKSALSNKNSIDTIKDKIHVPILLLHECDLTKDATEMHQAYLDAVTAYHRERAVAYFERQISKLQTVFKYNLITFHLVLFPVPDKEKIVDMFKVETNNLRG